MKLKLQINCNLQYFKRVYYYQIQLLCIIMRICGIGIILINVLAIIAIMIYGVINSQDLLNLLESFVGGIFFWEFSTIIGAIKLFLVKNQKRDGKVEIDFTDQHVIITFFKSNEKISYSKDMLTSIKKIGPFYRLVINGRY